MKNIEVATIGGGCFWCIETIFQRLKGVETAISGYSGGTIKNPSYKEVCNGTTGHAEVVQITFDSSQLSYKDLIRIFMTSHDPTTLNRQGGDIGTQYRSVIFYHNEQQAIESKEIIEELTSYYEDNIVTQIDPFEVFYPAEEYHQNYYNQNTSAGYCNAVISPKLAKFKKLYADRLKENA